MKITKFGSYTFPVLSEQDDFGGGSLPSGFIQTPYGSVNVINEATDFYGGVARKRMELSASTPGALATALDEVYALKGEFDQLYQETFGGDERWTYSRCIAVRHTRTVRNFIYQMVDCEFQIANSLWNGDAGDGSTSKSSGQTTTINNGGNANVNDMILTLTPTANATAIDIACADSGVDLLFTDQVDANDDLVINAGTWEVYNNNANAWADLTFAQHTFAGLLRLVPGDNDFVISWTGGGTMTVDYAYYDKWK